MIGNGCRDSNEWSYPRTPGNTIARTGLGRKGKRPLLAPPRKCTNNPRALEETVPYPRQQAEGARATTAKSPTDRTFPNDGPITFGTGHGIRNASNDEVEETAPTVTTCGHCSTDIGSTHGNEAGAGCGTYKVTNVGTLRDDTPAAIKSGKDDTGPEKVIDVTCVSHDWSGSKHTDSPSTYPLSFNEGAIVVIRKVPEEVKDLGTACSTGALNPTCGDSKESPENLCTKLAAN